MYIVLDFIYFLLCIFQCTAVQSTNGLTGRLLSSKELDAYESLWHTRVFTPSWNSLEKEVSKTAQSVNISDCGLHLPLFTVSGEMLFPEVECHQRYPVSQLVVI